MSVVGPGDRMTMHQASAVEGALRYIHRLNQQRPACHRQEANTSGSFDVESSYEQLFYPNGNRTLSDDSAFAPCWIPVVEYGDVKHNFESFIEDMMQLENPPALVLEKEGHAGGEPRQVGENGMWVSSYAIKPHLYVHHRLVKSKDGLAFDLVDRNTRSLENLPDDLKQDETYVKRIQQLRVLADHEL